MLCEALKFIKIEKPCKSAPRHSAVQDSYWCITIERSASMAWSISSSCSDQVLVAPFLFQTAKINYNVGRTINDFSHFFGRPFPSYKPQWSSRQLLEGPFQPLHCFCSHLATRFKLLEISTQKMPVGWFLSRENNRYGLLKTYARSMEGKMAAGAFGRAKNYGWDRALLAKFKSLKIKKIHRLLELINFRHLSDSVSFH